MFNIRWVSTYFIVSPCFTMTPFWSTWSEIFLDKCCTSDTCSTWRVKLRSWLKCWMILKDSPRPPKIYLGHTNMKNSIEPGVYHIYIYIYYIYILFTYLKYNTFSAFYSRCKGLKRYQFFITPIFRLPVISPPTSSPAPNEAWGGWHPAPLARREGTTENTEHREPILYINNIYIYTYMFIYSLYILEFWEHLE